MKRIAVLLFSVFLCLSALAADRAVLSAIEVGSKGVKAVGVEVMSQTTDTGYTARVIYKKDLNPNIMSGVANRLLQKERISATAEAVQTLFNDLKRIDPQFIVIVASTAFDNVDNRGELSDAIKEAVGKPLNFITSDEEMYFGLLAAVPKRKLGTSILIDVGSGNTKIGYYTTMSPPNNMESLTIPYGTVTLKEKGRAAGGVPSVIDGEILPKLRTLAQDKPGISSLTRTIYILGGASWALTNLSFPEEHSKSYASVKISGIKRTLDELNAGTFKVKSGSPKYEDETNRIFDVFTPEDLKAGGSLLYAILKEIGGENRKIIFPRESGWILGYMFAQYNDFK